MLQISNDVSNIMQFPLLLQLLFRTSWISFRAGSLKQKSYRQHEKAGQVKPDVS